ncbi:MAG: hypothetical protein QF371_03120, partial [Flavobacteriales bacterium]|nr:hypothetical protein [Flavobacteriales bacterium]
MSKSFVNVMLFASVNLSQAQVYNGQNFPSPGDSYILLTDTAAGSYNFDVNMLESDPPWYFTQPVADFVDTIRFNDAATSPFAGSYSFATTTIEESFHDDSLGTYFIYESNGDILCEGQLVIPPSNIPFPLIYNDPLMWLNLPIQLGASSRDTAQGELIETGAEVGLPVDSVHFKTTHYHWDTVDAVGTITIPGLILENVIRRIHTDSIIDSIFVKTGGVWSLEPQGNEGYSLEKRIEWYHEEHDWVVAQALVSNEWIKQFRYIIGPPPSIRLEFSGLPTYVTGTQAIPEFEVTAYDIATGDLATWFTDSIRITEYPDTGGWFNWQVDEASVLPVAGVATFNNLIFYQTGERNLLARSDTALTDTIVVTVHPPSTRLEFMGLPTEISTMDTIHEVQVGAYDISTGNLITDLTDSVLIGVIGDSLSSWQSDDYMVPAVSGIATFHNFMFLDAGQYRLHAASDTLLSDTSELIIVHPAATHIDIGLGQTSIIQNQYLPILNVSAMTDSNTVDELYYLGNVRVGKLSGPGEILGTHTQPFVNGIATFDDLKITHEGQYELLFYSPIENRYLRQDTLIVDVSSEPGDWILNYTDTLTEYVARANEFLW